MAFRKDVGCQLRKVYAVGRDDRHQSFLMQWLTVNKRAVDIPGHCLKRDHAPLPRIVARAWYVCRKRR